MGNRSELLRVSQRRGLRVEPQCFAAQDAIAWGLSQRRGVDCLGNGEQICRSTVNHIPSIETAILYPRAKL